MTQSISPPKEPRHDAFYRVAYNAASQAIELSGHYQNATPYRLRVDCTTGALSFWHLDSGLWQPVAQDCTTLAASIQNDLRRAVEEEGTISYQTSTDFIDWLIKTAGWEDIDKSPMLRSPCENLRVVHNQLKPLIMAYRLMLQKFNLGLSYDVDAFYAAVFAACNSVLRCSGDLTVLRAAYTQLNYVIHDLLSTSGVPLLFGPNRYELGATGSPKKSPITKKLPSEFGLLPDNASALLTLPDAAILLDALPQEFKSLKFDLVDGVLMVARSDLAAWAAKSINVRNAVRSAYGVPLLKQNQQMKKRAKKTALAPALDVNASYTPIEAAATMGVSGSWLRQQIAAQKIAVGENPKRAGYRVLSGLDILNFLANPDTKRPQNSALHPTTISLIQERNLKGGSASGDRRTRTDRRAPTASPTPTDSLALTALPIAQIDVPNAAEFVRALGLHTFQHGGQLVIVKEMFTDALAKLQTSVGIAV